MSIHYQCQNDQIIIIGHTYPYKEIIKALGGKFDGRQKNWHVPLIDDNLEKIQSLCRSAGGGELPSSSSQKGPAKPSKPLPIVQIEESASTATKKQPDDLSIKELLARIESVVQNNFSQPIWIIGEIQNLQSRSIGLFLQLAQAKDDNNPQLGSSTINTTIWKTQYQLLKNQIKGLDEFLKDGTKIRCLVQVNFYKDRGQISLSILNVDSDFILGELALARMKLVKELKAKGLYDKNQQQYLTKFPLRIGLITAKDSRAYSDFVDQLFTGGFPGEVVFFQCPMQGDQVTQLVPKAIQRLSESNCDLIVLTRGGGSAADLRWFDTAEVAIAIANCSLPVICAIGHHDDVCVAEEVSFSRAKTPTAAAESILSIFADRMKRLDAMANELRVKLTQTINATESQLNKFNQLISAVSNRYLLSCGKAQLTRLGQLNQSTSNLLHRMNQRLLTQQNRMATAINRYVSHKREQLLIKSNKINSLDPSPWLTKGWTQIFRDSEIVKSIDSVNVEDTLKAVLLDGDLEMQVLTKQKRKEYHLGNQD